MLLKLWVDSSKTDLVYFCYTNFYFFYMSKKTLVIGASINPERYAYKALCKLKENHYEVCALGPKVGTVFGVKIDTEQKLYKNIHTVSLYLNPKRQEEFYAYIIQLNPQRVIFNPGTENPDFFKRLERHNISYEIACTLVLLSTNQY